MAKFLTTVGNSYYIEQLIINSSESLTLVTPFLKLSRNLIERISDAEKDGVRITLIYGKNELAQKEKDKLKTFENLEIYFCENLHAKCYHNETSMIITSMNLYEFSERNNREMGLFIKKDEDSEIFKDSLKEIDSIKNSSIKEKIFNEKEEDVFENHIKMQADYNENWNFHLPSLNNLLSNKYSGHKIIFDENIIIQDFPFKGAYLVVNGRIDLMIENNAKYELIKRLNKDIINKILPEMRFYWNYKQLSIYTEKGFSPETNIKGLKEQVIKFMLIIDALYENLKK